VIFRKHSVCSYTSVEITCIGKALNNMLRRIFGTEREEVAEGWRRKHNEELHNLFTSLNIIRVIKSRRMR